MPFLYKGKAIDLKQTGRELNVRYILEGSVQRAGDRMRVNVQLIDAESGNQPLGGSSGILNLLGERSREGPPTSSGCQILRKPP